MATVVYILQQKQLPILHRALTHEFKLFLPRKIADADARASDFVKIQRKTAVIFFCHLVNQTRSDGLQLVGLLDRDRVDQLAIVQQITDSTPKGQAHHFKFYAGDTFFPEIFLSRRRLIFSTHALERFFQRVPKYSGSSLKTFLMTVFETPYVLMFCGGGYALAVQYENSLFVMPIEQRDEGLVILTCLTVDEIQSLEMGTPSFGLNLHYDPDFKLPRIRNWSPTLRAMELIKAWKQKSKLPAAKEVGDIGSWSKIAAWIRDVVEIERHGEGSRLVFLDNIPGPCSISIRPD